MKFISMKINKKITFRFKMTQKKGKERDPLPEKLYIKKNNR